MADNQPKESSLRFPHILIAPSVADRFTEEIQKNPHIEVGGKYLGFIHGRARYDKLSDRINALGDLTIEIKYHLDDGPKAQRTPTFHRGDAKWQTEVFRKLERKYPDIEQLGSWHSHHPNGLNRLSNGDIRGYGETVNDPGHNHDFFFVSLGVDSRGFSTARHYLFIRGDTRYYTVPADLIQLKRKDAESPSSATQAANEVPHRQAKDEHAGQAPSPEKSASSASSATGAETGSQEHSATGLDERTVNVPGWSDTADGRKILARETELVRQGVFMGMKMSIHDGRLIVRGEVDTNEGRVFVSLLYPSMAGRVDGLLKLKTLDKEAIEVTLPGSLSPGLEQTEAALADFLHFVHEVRRRSSTGQHFVGRFWNYVSRS